MRIKIEVEVPDTYTKGCCYDCPFGTQWFYEDDDDGLGVDYGCALMCRYDECPVIIEGE